MPRTRRNQTVGVWMGLTGGVTPELMAGQSHIQDLWEKLVAFQEELDKLTLEQAFYDARKQEVTARMNVVLSEGRIVASLFKAVLKQHFGSRSEDLLAFGIKPFRGLKRARKAGASARTAKKAAAPEPSAE